MFSLFGHALAIFLDSSLCRDPEPPLAVGFVACSADRAFLVWSDADSVTTPAPEAMGVVVRLGGVSVRVVHG